MGDIQVKKEDIIAMFTAVGTVRSKNVTETVTTIAAPRWQI